MLHVSCIAMMRGEIRSGTTAQGKEYFKILVTTQLGKTNYSIAAFVPNFLISRFGTKLTDGQQLFMAGSLNEPFLRPPSEDNKSASVYLTMKLNHLELVAPSQTDPFAPLNSVKEDDSPF